MRFVAIAWSIIGIGCGFAAKSAVEVAATPADEDRWCDHVLYYCSDGSEPPCVADSINGPSQDQLTCKRQRESKRKHEGKLDAEVRQQEARESATAPESSREAANQLAVRAAAAAARGDCGTVRSLEGAIDDADPQVHDTVYLRDPKIQRCLAATSPATSTPTRASTSISDRP